MSFNVLDLFSGIGGFSLGLERAGMKTVAFCELDQTCQKVLRKHWPTIPTFSDVRKLSKETLFKNEITNIDVITSGFPCQDVSVANIKGNGLKGEKSGLWKETKRLIKELKPKYAIIENVPNLRSKGLAQIFKDLWKIGYNCEWHIISAASFDSCPHSRERIWIIAYANGQRCNSAESSRGKEKISTTSSNSSDLHFPRNETEKLEKGTIEISNYIGRGKFLLWENYISELERQERWRSLIKGVSLHWKAEPSICRMVDGLPRGLDKTRRERIKQLGNAVVPQIPELIGRAIILFEQSLSIPSIS